MNANRLSGSRGFTLIEVLVVVSIIALLLAVLLPSLARAREQSKIAVCLSHLHHCGAGFSAYVADQKGILPMRGGYNYDLRETEEYHFVKAVARSSPRTTVNYGLLYGKYCGKDGRFYFCPGNVMQDYDDPNNGWPTFFADEPSDPHFPRYGVTWGGYGYAAQVLPGWSPRDDPVITGGAKTASPGQPDANPGAWRQVGQPNAPSDRVPWPASYNQWLADQIGAGKQPYLGKVQALMTDQLITRFSHLDGAGQNVLFTDYHARWVADPRGYLRALSRDPGINSGTKGQLGLYAAWNFLSRRN